MSFRTCWIHGNLKTSARPHQLHRTQGQWPHCRDGTMWKFQFPISHAFRIHFPSEKMKKMSSLKNMPRPWRCWASLHPWWSRPANPPLDNSSNSILTRSCSTYVLFISFYHIFAYILQLHVWCRLMSNLLLIFHEVQFLYDLGWALTTEKRVFDRTETEKMCETLEVSIAKMCKGRSNLCFSIVLDVDPLRAAAMGWSLNFFLRVSKSPSMTYWTRLFKQ